MRENKNGLASGVLERKPSWLFLALMMLMCPCTLLSTEKTCVGEWENYAITGLGTAQSVSGWTNPSLAHFGQIHAQRQFCLRCFAGNDPEICKYISRIKDERFSCLWPTQGSCSLWGFEKGVENDPSFFFLFFFLSHYLVGHICI